jgi:hypothetical protein
MMTTQQHRAQSRDRYPAADDDQGAEDGEVGELPPPGDGKRPSAGDDGTSLGVEVSADTDGREDESTETWF